MVLPENILYCLNALERSGYEAWVVGGCVRDAVLGRTPKDYDICTRALPEQTRAVFAGHQLILAGEKHGTVGVVVEGQAVEITTYRAEGAYADSRHPDWVSFVGTIDQDLARRDFTVNAMAWSPSRGLRDPFGGRADLETKTLRAVGEPEQRFREDALRILRGIRFCAAYGLEPEEKTLGAMFSQRCLMDRLARERVYDELCGFLPCAGLEDLQRFAPILAQVIPELAPMIGFDQHSPHHAYDLYTHVAHVTAGVSRDLTVRWAALLHDIGKIPTFTRDETGRGHFYGHAPAGAKLAREVLLRLKAPSAMVETVPTLIANHMLRLDPDRKQLRRQLRRLGFDTVEKLLDLQEADMTSKGTGEEEGRNVFPQLRELLTQIRAEDDVLAVKDLAVNGNDLLALGLRGRQIGQALDIVLGAVIDERLENEKEAELAWLRSVYEV